MADTSVKCIICRSSADGSGLLGHPCVRPGCSGVYRMTGNSQLYSCVVAGHGQKFALGESCPDCPPVRLQPIAPPAFDPSGEGRKNGKVRVELVLSGMPNAIMELGRVMTWALEGKGYREGDFLNVPDAANKYRGAMYRHDLKELMGQELDDESGLCHAVHTAWNAIARLEILLREKKQ